MQAEPSNEHRWLQRLVGEWTYEAESESAPGEPPMRDTGTERMRSMGGVWVVGEARSDAGEGAEPSQSIITLGYDAEKQRFVGTFVASMMTYLWIYEGELDGNLLTLYTEGPSFTEEGGMARYRDTIELVSDDHRVMTSHQQAEDGTWRPFMTMHYRRTK